MAKMYETIKNSNKTPSNITGTGVGVGILRPKVSYQWRMKATGAMNSSSLSAQIVSCTRPSLTFDEIELPRESNDPAINRVRIAGKHRWEPLTIVIEDDLHGSAARVIEKQIRLQMDAFESDDPMASKFDINICAMDGNDVVADTWNITGCFIREVNYEDLDYSKSDAIHITLTIHFDHAQMELPELTFITD